MRRVVYLVSGIVVLNLTVIAGLWIHMRLEPAPTCDVEARGLVMRSPTDQVVYREPPVKPTNLAPCRGFESNEVTIYSPPSS